MLVLYLIPATIAFSACQAKYWHIKLKWYQIAVSIDISLMANTGMAHKDFVT